MRAIEKNELELAKKKEIDGIVQQARMEYMQKVNNHLGKTVSVLTRRLKESQNQ